MSSWGTAQRTARRRLRQRITVAVIVVAGVAIPAAALALGGGPHSDRGPGGYPASHFQDDNGRIGLVCTDHAYSPGETTTTRQPGEPDPACRPMTREELRKERTSPAKEAPPGRSQTPAPSVSSTTTTRPK